MKELSTYGNAIVLATILSATSLISLDAYHNYDLRKQGINAPYAMIEQSKSVRRIDDGLLMGTGILCLLSIPPLISGLAKVITGNKE